MGQCYSANLKKKSNDDQRAQQQKPSHLGPAGIEYRFMDTSEDEDAKPPKDDEQCAHQSQGLNIEPDHVSEVVQNRPEPVHLPSGGFTLSVEVGRLDDFIKSNDDENARRMSDTIAKTNSEANGVNTNVADHNIKAGEAFIKQTLSSSQMKRTFPPVGVSILLEQDISNYVSDEFTLDEMDLWIRQSLAEALGTRLERFKLMPLHMKEHLVNLNVLDGRDDEDQRSPMQLAAELVRGVQDSSSRLHTSTNCRFSNARIAEDPFQLPKKSQSSNGLNKLKNLEVHQSSSETQSSNTKPTEKKFPFDISRVKNTSELPGNVLAKDGGTYAGELEHGLRHGRGKHHYPNGDVYVGCFEHDKRHGIGRLTLANDRGTYLGEWQSDKRSGKGSWDYQPLQPNKHVYVGTWKNGLREGEGRLAMTDGFWYKGEFKQDFMHGHGFMQMENKDMFDGNFFRGWMHGPGTWTCASTGKSKHSFWSLGTELERMTVDEAMAEINMVVAEAARQGCPLGPHHPTKEAPDFSHVDHLPYHKPLQQNAADMTERANGSRGLQPQALGSRMQAVNAELHPPDKATDARNGHIQNVGDKNNRTSNNSGLMKRKPQAYQGTDIATENLLKEVKPPVRPNRAGAQLSTSQTLSLVAEKLAKLQELQDR